MQRAREHMLCLPLVIWCTANLTREKFPLPMSPQNLYTPTLLPNATCAKRNNKLNSVTCSSGGDLSGSRQPPLLPRRIEREREHRAVFLSPPAQRECLRNRKEINFFSKHRNICSRDHVVCESLFELLLCPTLFIRESGTMKASQTHRDISRRSLRRLTRVEAK